jgi:hypothetical protein
MIILFQSHINTKENVVSNNVIQGIFVFQSTLEGFAFVCCILMLYVALLWFVLCCILMFCVESFCIFMIFVFLRRYSRWHDVGLWLILQTMSVALCV